MGEKYLVCQGAICECNYGIVPDKLKVLTQSKRFINDKEGSYKLIATHKDVGNTFENNTFGKCKLQPTSRGHKACQPILTEWKGFYDKVKLEDNGGHPLLEDSMGNCVIGGACIKVSNHGQTAELSSQNFKNVNREIHSQINPWVDTREIIEEDDLVITENHLITNSEELQFQIKKTF